MKTVLSKIAKISHHEVKLADIGDLSKMLTQAKSEINEFMSGYSDIESIALKIFDLGEKALDSHSKLLNIGEEIDKKISELGLDPNSIPAYNDFENYKEDLIGEVNQIEQAMDLLDKITAKM